MKNLFKILILSLLLFSWIYCDGLSIELGGGPYGFSGGFGIDSRNWFMSFQSNFSNRSEDDTYDFSPNLFDDSDRGKLKEYGTIIIGRSIPILKNNHFYYGGGISMFKEYYERYDSSEILSDNGTYYITDDNSNQTLPTLYFGLTNRISDKTDFGVSVNLVPLNLSLFFLFKFDWSTIDPYY